MMLESDFPHHTGQLLSAEGTQTEVNFEAYGMSLLSRSAHGWCHIQWTNIEREDKAIRPRPNKNNLETRIQNWQICYLSLQKFQFHIQGASL